jgi:hypothetical protein
MGDPMTAAWQMPPFPGLYQVAYVTNQIFAAQRLFGETYGLASFMQMHDIHYPTRDGRQAHCHVSLAYLGALEIELIQPLDGDVQHYLDYLPAQPKIVQFHHTCQLFDSEEAYEAKLAQYRATGREFPIDAATPGNRYFYCDFTADLGHYVEGLYLDETRRDWLNEIPRY